MNWSTSFRFGQHVQYEELEAGPSDEYLAFDHVCSHETVFATLLSAIYN